MCSYRGKAMGAPRIAAALVAAVLAAGAPAVARADAPQTSAPTHRHPVDGWTLISQLTNPVRPIWSVKLEDRVDLLQGERVAGTKVANSVVIEPSLPLVIGPKGSIVLALRLRFPLITRPRVTGGRVPENAQYVTGPGDLEFLRLIGPNRARGFVWGVGVTSRIPTALNKQIDEDLYQAGPAAQAYYLGDGFVVGALVQHWTSFKDGVGNGDVLRTDIDYNIEARLGDTMAVGMAPKATIDWAAPSGERVNWPVGLGLTRLVHVAALPVRLRLEAQYAVVHPDAIGNRWSFRVQIEPVIRNALE